MDAIEALLKLLKERSELMGKTAGNIVDRFVEDGISELAQLRADNDRVEKAYRLAVAECVKACKERDMHRRNWVNTMEHRDRLSAELAGALQMVAMAVDCNEHGWRQKHIETLQKYLGEHLEELKP